MPAPPPSPLAAPGSPAGLLLRTGRCTWGASSAPRPIPPLRALLILPAGPQARPRPTGGWVLEAGRQATPSRFWKRDVDLSSLPRVK